MKRLLIGILLIGIVALILPAFAVAQIAPSGDKALLAGPVYADGTIAGRLGYAKRLYGHVWAAGFGQFGQSVEASGEIVALFQITQQLYLGPVAGAGIDWSDAPGTATTSAENYFFYAAGGAGTYMFKGNFGLWGYLKYQATPKSDTDYQNEVSGGVGVLYRL